MQLSCADLDAFLVEAMQGSPLLANSEALHEAKGYLTEVRAHWRGSQACGHAHCT